VTLRDHSDTEVLFHLIRREGVRRAVERIDGMFAFAYRDGTTGALFLVRDRFGEKPLYYGVAGDDIVFASEIPAVQCHPAFAEVALDKGDAYRFLLYEYLPGSVSGWHGIAKLEPGCILTAKHGDIRIERYWRPSMQSVARGVDREEEAIDRLDDLLTASVRERVIADVPIGVFLSGGLDSSLITALAAKAAPDLTAFSVRSAGTASTKPLTRSRSRATSGCGTKWCRWTTRICSQHSMPLPTNSASLSRIRRCCPPTSFAGRRAA
jgi:asparagine synthase (glutamine-hydrolysing)